MRRLGTVPATTIAVSDEGNEGKYSVVIIRLIKETDGINMIY